MLGFGVLGRTVLGQISVSGSLSQTLLPTLLTNTNSFYTPKITLYLKSSLLSNTNTFYTSKLKLYLRPSLFTNTNSFYIPVVTRGPVYLLPSLFTNTNSFFTPKLTLYLLPSLFINEGSIYPFIKITVNRNDLAREFKKERRQMLASGGLPIYTGFKRH